MLATAAAPGELHRGPSRPALVPMAPDRAPGSAPSCPLPSGTRALPRKKAEVDPGTHRQCTPSLRGGGGLCFTRSFLTRFM